MRQRRLCLFALTLTLATAALADDWSFPKELVTTTNTFGDTRIVLEIDGTKDQTYPPHAISVFNGDTLLAKLPNTGFGAVYASPDNQFFVGLSNDGIPGTAFVVFDARGNLIREQKHAFMPVLIYSSMSVTRVREWFDAVKPEVEFVVEAGRLLHLHVNGSNGQRYDLLKADLNFDVTKRKQ